MKGGRALAAVGLVVILGLAAAVVGWQDRARQARAKAFSALEREWAGRGRVESWRTAPAWGGGLPEVVDAATPWTGADSVLGMVLISALRDDGRGLPADQWAGLLAAVAEERTEDPLLPVAEAAVGLRTGTPTDLDAGGAAPWRRWLELERSLTDGEAELAEPAVALLAAWPRHRGACLEGARWALARGRLQLARHLGEQCRWAGAPLLRLKGDLLDALGDSEGAWAAWSEARTDVHAAAISCQERLGHGLLALDDAAPPAVVHRGWCALVAGHPEAVAEARAALGRLPDEQPPVRLARSALALAVGDPGLAVELLGDLDSARALVLRGRALAALGDPEQARRAFAEARAQLPYERGVLLGWLAALPGDADRIGAGWSAAEVLMLAQSDLVGDRTRPWFLVAGQQSPAECRLCEVIPGLADALAGPPEDCAGTAGPWCQPAGSDQEERALRQAWDLAATDPEQSWATLHRLMERHPTLRGLPRLALQWQLPEPATRTALRPGEGAER